MSLAYISEAAWERMTKHNREAVRRKRQIQKRQIVPSMLKSDVRVTAQCIEAVKNGDTDATVSRALFDAYADVMGRVVTYDDDGVRIVINSRFVDPSEPRDHLMCRGRRLYRGAA